MVFPMVMGEQYEDWELWYDTLGYISIKPAEYDPRKKDYEKKHIDPRKVDIRPYPFRWMEDNGYVPVEELVKEQTTGKQAYKGVKWVKKSP
jgi:hypothetical protein